MIVMAVFHLIQKPVMDIAGFLIRSSGVQSSDNELFGLELYLVLLRKL